MSIRESDLHPDVLRKILEASIPQAIENLSKRRKRKLAFVEPGIALVNGRLTILAAVETLNESNQRQWRSKNRRAGQAWVKVRQAIGPHLGLLEPFSRAYVENHALRVVLTRLGGSKIDRLVGTASAVKGVEDAIAYLIGANDGDARWHASAEQEAGALVGIRIEIEVI